MIKVERVENGGGSRGKTKADKQIRQRWWKWKSRKERRWGQKGMLWVGMVEYTEVGELIVGNKSANEI